MDTSNVKKVLNDLIDKVMYLAEKDRLYDQVLKRKDDEIKKSKIAYNELLGNVKIISEKNKKLLKENVYLKERVKELNDTLSNQYAELDKCINILEKVVN